MAVPCYLWILNILLDLIVIIWIYERMKNAFKQEIDREDEADGSVDPGRACGELLPSCRGTFNK